MEQIEIITTRKHEIVNITGLVAGIVRASGVRDGLCLVQSLHTTAGVYVNVTEHLEQDVLSLLNRLAPEENYAHNRVDPNAEAHLKKILTGRTATITIENGRLALGTWEKIQFAEFDGPRKRTVHVKLVENAQGGI